MSEYTPITGELRELLADINWIEILDHVHTNGGGICDGDWLDHWHEQAEHVCDAIDSAHAQLERENAALKAELDRVLGEQEDKALTYEEAKQLCMKAFDGGATYGSESMRYGVNARAYDWEHWLEKHESLFKPTDTWERIIDDAEALAHEWFNTDMSENEHAEGLDALVSRCKALCERTKGDA